MAGKERQRRQGDRFFFHSPKQEGRHLIFNLSRRGALFAGMESVRIGQSISLEVTLPLGMANLKLAGRARWVRRVGEDENGLCLVGMQFEEQDETTARILEAYLQFLQRERTIQKHRALAIAELEKLNRFATLDLLKKEGLSDQFH
jgi:Tfp pilus assembly protein PilZ